MSTPQTIWHSDLANLVGSNDDHTQYALLAGRSGGQVIKGGTASGADLTFWSTSHATKGQIFIGSSGDSYKHEATQKWTFQETISNASSAEVAFWVLPTLSGAGDFPQGARFTPVFSPSASISATYGFIGIGYASPAATITITEAKSGYSGSGYLDVAGAVTTGIAHRVAAPEISGALKPGTQYGVKIDNQGATGIVCELPPYAVYSRKCDSRNPDAAEFPIELDHKYAIAILINQDIRTSEAYTGDDWISTL